MMEDKKTMEAQMDQVSRQTADMVGLLNKVNNELSGQIDELRNEMRAQHDDVSAKLDKILEGMERLQRNQNIVELTAYKTAVDMAELKQQQLEQ